MSWVLLHPATIHFPIAFLIAASVAGLAYIHWRPMAQLSTIVWWSTATGWFSLIAAIITGLISQGALPPDAPYRTILNWHTTTGLILAVLYGDVLYRGWLHNSGKGKANRPQRSAANRQTDRRGRQQTGKSGEAPLVATEFLAEPRQKWLLSVEFAAGIVLIFATGWLGGELVYTWGVNVMK
ncbi:MAG: DUF2231 domain-containing protein [Caldilineaceae bacterium]